MNALRLLIAVLIPFAVAACMSAGQIESSGPRYATTAGVTEDYRLGVGDKLGITVFNEDSLSGEFTVAADGTLSVPLIGAIDVVDMSPSELSRELATRLSDGYLREPKVTVEILSYRPYFILGEVRAPGQYPYASGLTAINAIAAAQGFTPRGNENVVFIRKFGSAKVTVYRLTPELRVWPGDTIRITERYF